jgi:hypothetical protein
MDRTTQKLSEDEIVEFLVNSGYEENIIRKALTKTSSRDTDDIVDCITKLEQQENHIKIQRQVNKTTYEYDNSEANKVLEDNKKAILAERKYREELIRRYREDRKSREEEEKEHEPNLTDVKNVEIKPDCVFNVRFPDSKLIKLSFSKTETVEDLFNRIEAEYGSSKFTLFKMRDPEPIIKSNIKLKDCKKIFPKAALFIE